MVDPSWFRLVFISLCVNIGLHRESLNDNETVNLKKDDFTAGKVTQRRVKIFCAAVFSLLMLFSLISFGKDLAHEVARCLSRVDGTAIITQVYQEDSKNIFIDDQYVVDETTQTHTRAPVPAGYRG